MIQKIIVTKGDEYSIEHPGKSFSQVFQEVKGKKINIYLCRYDDNGNGWIYTSEAIIGNATNELTMSDYWQAYDQII